ncbi:MAG: VanW family protein [Lachnospiraceae bacterium]|jgi:vancomycin resistance protein YoaR|nr:VanW family protein [Lachnospiraceae bacterium]
MGKKRKDAKIGIVTILFVVSVFFFALLPSEQVSANGTFTNGAFNNASILDGIFIDGISLGGYSEAEAVVLINNYEAFLRQQQITMYADEDNFITVTAEEIGFTWSNPGIVAAAAALGQKGNIITRYKAIKDLQNDNVVFELEYFFDPVMVTDIIEEHFGNYREKAIDATMVRDRGETLVTEGQPGYYLDIRESVDKVMDYLEDEWGKNSFGIDLVISVLEPRGSYEELSRLTDVMGTFTTSFSASNANRRVNIGRATELINGTLIYPGEEFSTLDLIAPFTEENGYREAGMFLMGQLVDSLGGGICQVSTTLYMAVLHAELTVLERRPHSMMVTYVEPSFDAAIASSSNRDFRFINNTNTPLYVEGRVTSGGNLTFSIYGENERPANRRIEFESEIMEMTVPEGESIIRSASEPVGHLELQSAYIGYKSRLWKRVFVDGVQVERVLINSSNYTAVPRILTVGMLTHDAAVTAAITDAIATGSIDHVIHVVHSLLTPPE